VVDRVAAAGDCPALGPADVPRHVDSSVCGDDDTGGDHFPSPFITVSGAISQRGVVWRSHNVALGISACLRGRHHRGRAG
jgi:hypothetical protein